MGFLSKLLTMGEGKQLKRYQAKVDKINALEPEFQALSDEELAAAREKAALLAKLGFFSPTPEP